MNKVHTVFLRRHKQVFLGPRDGNARANAELLAAFEARLLTFGHVMTGRLREGLADLPTDRLKGVAEWVCTNFASYFGDYAFPQFKNFPDSIPPDTHALWVDRVLAYLYQEPTQPCVLCGKEGEVHAVSPCAHLVCRNCWDGAEYSGCPICHRRIHRDDPFLKPARPRTPLYTMVLKLRLLDLGEDFETASQALFTRLCKRVSPLSPIDALDFDAFVQTYQANVLRWLPERIPVKETMARLFGSLLKMHNPPEQVFVELGKHARTATDLLRVLVAYWGGDPSFVVPLTRFPSMPRKLRKAILARLEAMDFALLTEDLHRWPGLWKRAGEVLHVFEYHRQFPKAALAMAVLRNSAPQAGNPLGDALLLGLSQHPGLLLLKDGKLHFYGWAGKVEEALAARKIEEAIQLLSERPGELSRRFDHLLMRAIAHGSAALDASLSAFQRFVPRMSPAILLTLMAHFGKRHAPFPKRVFFPKGQVLKAWVSKDARPLIPAPLGENIVHIVTTELLRRSAAQAPFPAAIVDAALRDMPLPFAERTTARALVALPRGSFVPLEEARFYRLFCHWMEATGQRADLDLSVSCYNDKWQFVNQCDYTQLVMPDKAAIHSGDYTSAPEPDGAAEYVDLDFAQLKAQGIRYVVMVVFSYDGIPFDRLKEAFAGMMARHDATGEVFEPRTVMQRFDLAGDAMVFAPMFVDLEANRLFWLDANLAEEGTFHRVWEYRAKLAHLGRDFQNYFLHGTRASMWDIACLLAAGRTPNVWVRFADGQMGLVARRQGESTMAFYHRLHEVQSAEGAAGQPDLGQPLFAALYNLDFELPLGSTFYALYADAVGTGGLTRLQASDLPAQLTAPKA